MPSTPHAMRLGGEPVTLLPDGAVHWPAARTLFVADVHLGKAETFQAMGVPVPAGDTAASLARLSRLVADHAAGRLVVLGDFYHAREGLSEAVLDALQAWRGRHPDLAVDLVLGNHDRAAGASPSSLGIREVEGPVAMGPFRLMHYPPARAERPDAERPGAEEPDAVVLCGHLHPAVRLRLGGRPTRVPCFHLARGVLTLPAFGTFTGTSVVRPREGDQVFVVADDSVIPLT
jgi:DNA ligase-associated metallophosphoesterase